MNEPGAFDVACLIGALATLLVWLGGFYLTIHGFQNTVEPFHFGGPLEMVFGVFLVVYSPKLSDRR